MFQERPKAFVGAPDLSKPSREALIWLLRHEPGDKFDYFDCWHCAMAVAHRVWPQAVRHPISTEVAGAIGIPPDDAHRIFVRRERGFTPEAIAADLEALGG